MLYIYIFFLLFKLSLNSLSSLKNQFCSIYRKKKNIISKYIYINKNLRILFKKVQLKTLAVVINSENDIRGTTRAKALIRSRFEISRLSLSPVLPSRSYDLLSLSVFFSRIAPISSKGEMHFAFAPLSQILVNDSV